MTNFPLTSLALIIALAVYFYFVMQVGKARGTWSVAAPAASGHPEFDKRYRVQMNTLEQLVLFVPALWLAAPVLGDLVAALIALVWSIGRIVYFRAYCFDPKTRTVGFMMTLLPTLVLLVAAVVGAVRVLMAG